MNDSVSFVSALVAGFLSFVSPCVLPLVPVYISTMTGLSVDELTDESKSRPLAYILMCAVAFCLGLSAVFVALGLTATAVGQFLSEHLRTFETVAGILIIIFGLHMTGLLKIAFLYRSFQVASKAQQPQTSPKRKGALAFVRPFLMGGAFAFGWTPCVGPILAAVLALAAQEHSVARGGLLLAVYSAGLAVPFLLAAAAFGVFMSAYKKFRRHLHTVEIISGVLLIIFGALIASHRFSLLAAWFSRYLPTPEM